MRCTTRFILGFASLFMFAGSAASQPYSGTVFIDPDILTAADPTTFTGITYAGRGNRQMYDRRVSNWITVNAYLFDATYSDGLAAEIQVNPEFGSVSAAMVEAEKYGLEIGRVPTALRADVETVWIHRGVEPFGGGNNNLLIHTGQGDSYIAGGFLEEVFIHEAAHTSLDPAHRSSSGWLTAQDADPNFISTYARDNPTREDIAESFLPYLAVRYLPDRISASTANTINATIPNRIAYFDSFDLDMFPTPPPRLVGDYNQNGIVDGADYVVWRDTLGTQAPKGSGADGNANGRIEATDYDVWKEHYGERGQGAIAIAIAHTPANVPEPASAILALLVACAGILSRGKRRASLIQHQRAHGATHPSSASACSCISGRNSLGPRPTT